MRKPLAAGGGDVEQDLESHRRQARRDFFQAVAAHHEEAAHRIAEIGAHQPVGQPGRQRGRWRRGAPEKLAALPPST